ncbi:hypothetical protein, partial [Methylobacterium platani]|uniref:hypothetical protein n=1 Tax=Methylobacterium platani TaxID=427683 RepID=UPI001AE003F1
MAEATPGHGSSRERDRHDDALPHPRLAEEEREIQDSEGPTGLYRHGIYGETGAGPIWPGAICAARPIWAARPAPG